MFPSRLIINSCCLCRENLSEIMSAWHCGIVWVLTLSDQLSLNSSGRVADSIRLTCWAGLSEAMHSLFLNSLNAVHHSCGQHGVLKASAVFSFEHKAMNFCPLKCSMSWGVKSDDHGFSTVGSFFLQ